MVNGELVAIRGGPARPEQRDASFRLDLNEIEAPLETIAERLDILIEILEHAFLIIEPQQKSRGAVRLDAATEDRRPEQNCALAHDRTQMVDRFQLLGHAAWQTMQHVG